MFKRDFPYFDNARTIYLDNAATTQKPRSVIDSQIDYYEKYCANTHRSSYGDANMATKKYEDSRKILKEFINARKTEEIIFTKGVTEAINLIADTFTRDYKSVIISSLEHHSNIVPWHMQGRNLTVGLKVIDCDSNLNFDFIEFENILEKNPNSFVSITHISNAFGKIYNIKRVIDLAHKYDSVVLIDAAQSLTHFKIDVQELDVDFMVFSSHKAFGPTGVGALYVKEEHLKDMSPYQTGGATIDEVDFNSSTLLPSPYKFEAGTQNIAGVIGFGEALKYITHIGYENIETIEKDIYNYLDEELKKLPNIVFYNDIEDCIGSRSFNFKGISHDDIGILLDKMGVAVRVGHHCAQPIMKHLGIKGTIRVSIAFYNDYEDINNLIKALKKAQEMLS